jgi:hypothetical protein
MYTEVPGLQVLTAIFGFLILSTKEVPIVIWLQHWLLRSKQYPINVTTNTLAPFPSSSSSTVFVFFLLI